jgi:hypothetical protein
MGIAKTIHLNKIKQPTPQFGEQIIKGCSCYEQHHMLLFFILRIGPIVLLRPHAAMLTGTEGLQPPTACVIKVLFFSFFEIFC